MDERIPRRLRRIIDVESGLNDGLATPLVLFFLAGAVASGGPAGGEAPLVHALVELAIGVAVGVVIGAGGARLLVSARRTSWSSVAGERLAVLVLPVLTYLTAMALGGNGFVAGFMAGIAAGTVGREEVAEERLQLTNDVGTLVSAAVWFVFGSLIPESSRWGSPGTSCCTRCSHSRSSAWCRWRWPWCDPVSAPARCCSWAGSDRAGWPRFCSR